MRLVSCMGCDPFKTHPIFDHCPSYLLKTTHLSPKDASSYLWQRTEAVSGLRALVEREKSSKNAAIEPARAPTIHWHTKHSVELTAVYG